MLNPQIFTNIGSSWAHSSFVSPSFRVSWLSLFIPTRRTLVGEGAREFASQTGTGVQVVPMESLITSQARDEWQKWKDRLEGAQQKDAEVMPDGLRDVQDTVGAVACRCSNGVAAGVSR